MRSRSALWVRAGATFYNDAFSRLGYGDEVARVAELWQAGRRDEARAAVPIDLGRLTNLVGTPAAIAVRLEKYRAVGITTQLTKLDGGYERQLATLERLLALMAGVSVEFPIRPQRNQGWTPLSRRWLERSRP